MDKSESRTVDDFAQRISMFPIHCLHALHKSTEKFRAEGPVCELDWYSSVRYLHRGATSPFQSVKYCLNLMRIVLMVTQVKVIILGIANQEETWKDVDDRCSWWIFSKVTSLVSAEETLGLDFRSWTSRKLLVEADYALHTSGILCGANSSWRGHLGWDKGRKGAASNIAHFDDSTSRLDWLCPELLLSLASP